MVYEPIILLLLLFSLQSGKQYTVKKKGSILVISVTLNVVANHWVRYT